MINERVYSILSKNQKKIIVQNKKRKKKKKKKSRCFILTKAIIDREYSY